jgi:hypothetical protein
MGEGETEQHGRSSMVMTGGRYWWKGGEIEAAAVSIVARRQEGEQARHTGAVQSRPKHAACCRRARTWMGVGQRRSEPAQATWMRR